MLLFPRYSRGAVACCLLLATMAGGCAKNYKPAWQQNLEEMWTHKERDKNDGIETPAEYTEKLIAWAEEAPKTPPEEQEKRALEMAERLGKEDDALIRARIIRTLAVYNTTTSTAMLTAAVKDRDEDVRIACCEAWGKRKGPDATRILTELLGSDTNLDVRLAASRALGETADPSCVSVLGPLLDNSDPAVQYCAVRSLKKITGKEYGDDIATWREYVKGSNPPEQSLASRLKSWF
jgi:HEAT repeat protein